MYITKPYSYGPGEILTFETEGGGPASALAVTMEPQQDLNGYDNPWPAGGGKNIGQTIVTSEITVNEVKFTPNTDGSITLNGTATSYTFQQSVFELAAGSYIVSKGNYSNTSVFLQIRKNDGDVYITGSTFGDASFTLSEPTVIRFRLGIGNGATANNHTVYPMLRLASISDPTFVPYQNICPISGWTEAKVWVKSTHDTSSSPTVTIDLDGTRYGGTLDVVSGTLTVEWETLTVNGENAQNLSSGNVIRLRVPISIDSVTWNDRTAPSRMLLSAEFPEGTNDQSYDGRVCVHFRSNGTHEVVFGFGSSFPSVSTFAEAVSWMNNNPQQVVYKLAAPVEYQLTPAQINTLLGTNNVWSDAGEVSISFTDIIYEGDSPSEIYRSYLQALRGDFVKLAKLEFLNPDGNVAFALDNNPLNKRSGAFIQSGTISCNLQNGRRRQADVTLYNLDHEYDYAVNHIWFGQQIRLSEGLILPDGTEFYIPQGVFEIESPNETLGPGKRTVTYNLVDKWSNLDGTHFGNLEDVYSVLADTNILDAIGSVLKLDRFTMENDGANPLDATPPLFTNYYNDKTQTLTDGTTVSLIQAPYDFLSASTGTVADVVLGLAEMIAADVGYNANGRLVVNPSQDDIADQNKPILWEFREDEPTFLDADYTPKPADVYNDVIVVGATSDTNETPKGRAQNQDPTSDTCINRIGRKTIRLEMPNYYSDTICEDYALWQLKRYSTMSKEVTITCTQMFHIVENQLVTVQRGDKPGKPIERHIVQGFSRPIGQTGTMTINCISVNDYPNATLAH